MLSWAENSALGLWVSSSEWGYPITLALHTIGMATLVGIALMLSYRVIGLGSGMPLIAMQTFWRIALIGFGLNLLSGTALFFGSATTLWESGPFRLKIILITVGLFLTHQMTKVSIHRYVTLRYRFVALVTALVWLTALTAGRLIAY